MFDRQHRSSKDLKIRALWVECLVEPEYIGGPDMAVTAWALPDRRGRHEHVARWLTVAVPGTGHPDRRTRQAHFSDSVLWLASTSAKSSEKPKKRFAGGAGS